MLLKNIRKIYTFPKTAQWLFAVIFSITGIILSFSILSFVYSPLWILAIPIIKTIGHFSIAPLMRLTGFLNYYSPMLLVVRTAYNKWELHNGTTFDYILNMKWKQKGADASKFIMINYLKGLLKIITEIEQKKVSNEITILGISYIINKKTAERLGFTVEKPGIYRRLLFFIDYFTLFLMYSFSKGRIAFPNIFKVKKVRITGNKLVASKEKIKQIMAGIINRHNHAEIIL